MKRKIVITGLCLFVLLSAGWILRAARQQTQKISTTPAPPLRVEPAGRMQALVRLFERSQAVAEAIGQVFAVLVIDPDYRGKPLLCRCAKEGCLVHVIERSA